MAVVGSNNCEQPVEIQETINDMEDYIEYMHWDIQEGKIDSATGAQYIENFNQTLFRLYELR